MLKYKGGLREPPIKRPAESRAVFCREDKGFFLFFAASRAFLIGERDVPALRNICNFIGVSTLYREIFCESMDCEWRIINGTLYITPILDRIF